jgi:protein-disulfide isomerase
MQKSSWIILFPFFILTVIIFVFFAMSLPVRDSIRFTDLPDITAPTVTFVDNVRGPSDAQTTIVLFGEYGCVGCRTMETRILALLDDPSLSLRYVWKDLVALDDTPSSAARGALAARCAGEQKHFWEFHDILMRSGSLLGNTIFSEISETIGISRDTLLACIDNQNTAALVERDILEAEALGITTTPTIFVNEQRVTGLVTEQELRAMIDRSL